MPLGNENSTDCLKLYGKDHYELGRNAGRSSGRKIRFLVKSSSRWAKRHPIEYEWLSRGLRRRKAILSTRSSSRIEELKGLASGTGLDRDDLLSAIAIIESYAAGQCTNFGAVPPATKDDGVIVSYNFDADPIFRLVMGRFPFFVREVEGTIPYLCIGVPALFGIGLLNAEGLCCTVNAVGLTDDGEGLSPFELNNRAMETCKEVGEVAKIYEERPRRATWAKTLGMLMNWNTIWADKAGNLSLFECSHNHFHQEKGGGEGIVASANHHQFLDRSLSGSTDPITFGPIAGPYSRLARMWALLREYHGRIDPWTAKSIISDHIPDYSLLKEFGIEREWWEDKIDDSTICSHAWNSWKHVLKGNLAGIVVERAGITLYSFQIQPKSSTVWFTCGHPCRNSTRPIYFGEVLGADCEPVPYSLTATGSLQPRIERKERGIFRQNTRPFEAFLARVWRGVLNAVEKPLQMMFARKRGKPER